MQTLLVGVGCGGVVGLLPGLEWRKPRAASPRLVCPGLR